MVYIARFEYGQERHEHEFMAECWADALKIAQNKMAAIQLPLVELRRKESSHEETFHR